MVAQGESSTGIRQRTRRRLLAVAAVALASAALDAAAQKKPPVAPAPEPAAKGAIVSYEELKQSAIVYLEESGGMTVRSAAPVAPAEDAPKAARVESIAPEERATSTGTGTGTSTRRAAPRSAAAAAR